MFDSISIRSGQTDNRPEIDIGTFAEALLFYQNVNVFLDSGNAVKFVAGVGIDNLRSLIRDGLCTVRYFQDHCGVVSGPFNNSAINEFSFTTFQIAKTFDGSDKRDRFVDPFVSAAHPDIPLGKVDRLFEAISIKDTKDLRIGEVDLIKAAEADVKEDQYLSAAVRQLLEHWVPEFKPLDRVEFKPHFVGDSKFIVETNLDFEFLNQLYHRHVPAEHSSISPAYILANILSTRQNLAIALRYGTELVATEASSKLMEIRIKGILAKRGESIANLARFDRVVLNNTHSIREAINSGALSFSDFRKTLNAATEFKAWLKSQTLDSDLVDSYYKEVTKDGFLDKLPTRATRFSIFTLMGVSADLFFSGGLGVAAGVSLSILDSLIIEKLLKGWKPNQFVEGNLKKSLDR